MRKLDIEPFDQQHNVANLLCDIAEQFPQKVALVFQQAGREQSITFGELWSAASSCGQGLLDAGFQPADRAIIMIPMSIDLYVSLLAVIQIGGVAVFVDPWISAKQIAQFAAFAEPTAYIGIGKSHLLRLFHKRLRGIRISVTSGRRFWRFPARYSLDQLRNNRPDSPVQPVQPHDSALITFTSGSSGEPKGANRTHRFLKAQHEALSHEFPYELSDVDMPMFPVFALNNLVTGITSVVPEMDFRKVAEVDGAKIAAQMAKHRVTTVTASPPLIDRVGIQLENQHSTSPQQPVRLRRILTGGAPVTDRQLSNWLEHYPNTELVVAYGSTEAEPVGHIVAQQRLALAAPGRGFCTGQPTSLIETRIIPIAKNPVDLQSKSLDELALGVGEIGELIVSGNHVCRDYFKNELATRENKLIDSSGRLWHRMGDTGYFDREGRFWLVGRVHSTIRRNEEWIHPQLIEQIAMNAVPDLSQIAAIGCPDQNLGEQVVVIAVTEQTVSDDAGHSIEARIRSALGSAGFPCDQVQVTSVRLQLDPRHSSKIDYAHAREQFLAGK